MFKIGFPVISQINPQRIGKAAKDLLGWSVLGLSFDPGSPGYTAAFLFTSQISRNAAAVLQIAFRVMLPVLCPPELESEANMKSQWPTQEFCFGAGGGVVGWFNKFS